MARRKWRWFLPVMVLTYLVMRVGPALAGEDWTQLGFWPPGDRPTSAFSDDPFRQFDFWVGEWSVNLRIRQQDFTWADQVTANVAIYPILNGRGILELWLVESPERRVEYRFQGR